MAATQAYRPAVTQYSGATRLRTSRTYAQQQQQQSQTTVITTNQGSSIPQLQSHQFVNAKTSNDGNGSTIGISTISSAQSPNRVSLMLFNRFLFKNSNYLHRDHATKESSTITTLIKSSENNHKNTNQTTKILCKS